MRNLQTALVSIVVLTWSAALTARDLQPDAATPPDAPSAPSSDPAAQEHRALQLMIEQRALQRRQNAFHEAVGTQLDPETANRFFETDANQTGVFVDEDMRVTHVVPGSPGHIAGLREDDRVVEINDTMGGDDADATARLFWAFKRMNPGDIASVTFERAEKRVFAQVPVISQAELAQLGQTEESADHTLREEQLREHWITYKQRSGLRDALGQSRLGVWDGLLLANVASGLGGRFDTEIGVLVLDSADPDHPIRAGDILTRVGDNRPADAQHAVRLLYDYENQPLIPMLVERGGSWLALEMSYPAAERLDRGGNRLRH